MKAGKLRRAMFSKWNQLDPIRAIRHLHLLQTSALHNFAFTRTSLLIRFDLDAVCGAVRLVARFKSCQFSGCAVA